MTVSKYLLSTRGFRASLICAALITTAAAAAPAWAQDASGDRQFGQSTSERQFGDRLAPVATPPKKVARATLARTSARPASVRRKHKAAADTAPAPVSAAVTAPGAAATVASTAPKVATPTPPITTTSTPPALPTTALVEAPASGGVPVALYGVGGLIAAALALLAGFATFRRRRPKTQVADVVREDAPVAPFVAPAPEPVAVEPEPVVAQTKIAPTEAVTPPSVPRVKKAPVQRRKPSAAAKAAPVVETVPAAKPPARAKKTTARPPANDDGSAPVSSPARRRKSAASGAPGQ